MDTLLAASVEPDEVSDLGRLIERHPDGALNSLLAKIHAAVCEGQDIHLTVDSHECSPGEAAKLLGVSRPTVYKLLDAEVLRYRQVGSHRKIALRDLLELNDRAGMARKRMAEDFATIDSARTTSVHERAGVDRETAKRLGF